MAMRTRFSVGYDGDAGDDTIGGDAVGEEDRIGGCDGARNDDIDGYELSIVVLVVAGLRSSIEGDDIVGVLSYDGIVKRVCRDA